jgi:hypothetical protein
MSEAVLLAELFLFDVVGDILTGFIADATFRF